MYVHTFFSIVKYDNELHGNGLISLILKQALIYVWSEINEN